MGVHKLNPNITNMKFQLTLALAAVCVANAGKIQDRAEAFASKQTNPVSDENQAKLQKAAKDNLDKYTNLAQAEGKKYGIEFDLSAVYASLNKQYGKQVKTAVNDQVAKAQGFAKNNQIEANLQKNQKLKNVQKTAKAATFEGILGRIQKELKDQVKNIPNKQVQKSLNSIVTQGAKEASNAMRANGLRGNIKKNVQKKFNQNKGPVMKKLAAKKNQAVNKLNQRINQQKF